MASKIVWTENALNDLEGITRFISQDSVHYARTMLQRIAEATDKLVEFPESGRIVLEAESSQCREIICSPYRVIYQIISGDIYIVTVLHGARRLTSDELPKVD